MKNPKDLLFLLLLFSLSPFFSSPSYAGKELAGTMGASFLKIGVGARSLGMGGAFTAVADDATAIYWNPAGLTQLKNRELLLMHINYLQGMKYEYISFIHPLNKDRAIGGAISYFHIGGLEERGEADELLGYFKAADLSIALAYACSLNSLSLGMSLKGIRQQIDLALGYGLAMDLGLLYKMPDPNLRLGVVVQNIGTDVSFKEGRYPLPINLKLGGSYRFLKGRLITAIDFNLPIDENLKSNFGIEYLLSNIALRAGYRNGYTERGWEAITFGIGFFRTRSHLINYDYAYLGYGSLGDTHRFSVGFRF